MYKESSHHASVSERYYQNPVLNGDWPDPAVFRDGEDFYLTASTARYYPSLTIWHSKDLVTWRPLCNPFPDFCGDVWAPDLLKFQDRYYLYFSSSGSNFVSWSHEIDRGWCAPIDLKVGHIDPGHCVENGKRYLMLSGGYMIGLTDGGLKTEGTLRQVITPVKLPDTWDIEGAYPESPKVTKRGGYYYYTYADGGTGGPATAHAVLSARAKSLFGPWEFSPYNPIVHTWSKQETWHAKGHGHLVDDVDGTWWILYHGFQKDYMTLGRSLLLERIEWTEDGWFRLHQTGSCDQPLQRPAGAEVTHNWQLSDCFTENRLSLSWKMLNRNDPGRITVGQEQLKLAACGGGPGEAPLVVASGDRSYQCSVRLEKPENCEAGLILIYDTNHFIAAGWDGHTLQLYRHGRKFESVAVTGARITLYLRNKEHDVAFYYSVDSGPVTKMNYVMATGSMNVSAYGGFSSLRPGLYAAGSGSAQFQSFEYHSEVDLC